MGVYYQIACDELRERIDPGYIDNLGIKRGAIACHDHPFGPMVIFALLNRWAGKQARLVDDTSDDPGYFLYQNVTAFIIYEYNQQYHTNFKLTE